jgi:putative exosortase-associated protein (TIGR04073 family)
MVKKVLFLILILNFILFSVFSQNNPLRKMARGVVNASLGWIEITRQMIKVNEKEGELAGFFWGSLKGLTFCLGRTILGVYEVSTFLFPPYRALVKPEFILSEEEEE